MGLVLLVHCLVDALVIVVRQQRLYVQCSIGALVNNFLYNLLNIHKNAVRCNLVADVIHTNQKEYLLWITGQYLVQPVINAGSIITHNTPVNNRNTLRKPLLEQCCPIATLCKAVAQHYKVIGIYRSLLLKLCSPLVIMVAVFLLGLRKNTCSHNSKSQCQNKNFLHMSNIILPDN